MAATAEQKGTVQQVDFVQDKVTKNGKVRFTLNPEEGGSIITGSIYVDPSMFASLPKPPQTITVRVAA
jgi:hypothetical protein